MACVIGVGSTKMGKFKKPAVELIEHALNDALEDCQLGRSDVQGLMSFPCIADSHTMQATFLMHKLKIGPHYKKDLSPEECPRFVSKTIDAGGSSPVQGLIEAERLVTTGGLDVVIVLGGDALGSMTANSFLVAAGVAKREKRDDKKKAESPQKGPKKKKASRPPVIPFLYNLVALWHMDKYGTTRNQLASASAFMQQQAAKHPNSMENKTGKPYTLEEILSARQVASMTGQYECARRADGAACVVVASKKFAVQRGLQSRAVNIVSTAEATSPLYSPSILPPKDISKMNSNVFCLPAALRQLFSKANMTADQMDWFGIYDCYPICFIKAIEDLGIADRGKGGEWVENALKRAERGEKVNVNTHGGLLAQGAPWDVPAMYTLVEAVEQLRNECGARQIDDVKNAFVYANGGIFTQSAVAILSTWKDFSKL